MLLGIVPFAPRAMATTGSDCGPWASVARSVARTGRPRTAARRPVHRRDSMQVGIMIEGQEGLTWERWFRLADAAEDLGYESLCRSDHLTGLSGRADRGSLETWTSL